MQKISNSQIATLGLVATLVIFTGIIFSPVNLYAQKETGTDWVRKDDSVYTVLIKEIERHPGIKPISLFFVYGFNAPVITSLKDNYSRVEMAGLEQWGAQAGFPILPIKPLRLLIPYGYLAAEIRVKLGPIEKVEGKYLVEPAHISIPINWAHPALTDYAVIYNSDQAYPALPCGEALIQYKHGYTILFLNLMPVEYHPLSRRIAYYQEMTVEVVLIPQREIKQLNPEERINKVNLDSDIVQEIRGMVDNPEEIESYIKNSGN